MPLYFPWKHYIYYAKYYSINFKMNCIVLLGINWYYNNSFLNINLNNNNSKTTRSNLYFFTLKFMNHEISQKKRVSLFN